MTTLIHTGPMALDLWSKHEAAEWLGAVDIYCSEHGLSEAHWL